MFPLPLNRVEVTALTPANSRITPRVDGESACWHLLILTKDSSVCFWLSTDFNNFFVVLSEGNAEDVEAK